MFNLKLDQNHDIIIGRGAARVHGVEQVAQLVKCRLLATFGDWQQDPSLGVPWFDGIFSKNVRLADIETALANTIRRTKGVLQLISLSISVDRGGRLLNVEFEAASVYGDFKSLVEWQPNMASLKTAL